MNISNYVISKDGRRISMFDDRFPDGTVYSYDYIMYLREMDRKKRNPYIFMPQLGGQENMISCNADVVIGGGSRGGGKSIAILSDALKDLQDRNFRGIVFRKALPDLDNLIDDSRKVYEKLGTFNQSKNDLTWNFNSGSWLKFGYYNDDYYEDFRDRFQGKQFNYIAIDEITQCPFDRFSYLLTCNRNAHGLRNHILGTCNPDPDSWVAKFVDWWIGEDGFPIPERCGVVRYFVNLGGEDIDVSNISWGDTREEVYEANKEAIDALYSPAMRIYGHPKDVFIKSATFIEAKLADNYQLMRSDPSYLANLASQSNEQKERDLKGNWKYRTTGDDMIKMQDMLNFYKNSPQTNDGVKRASCDPAFDGGDNLVMWLWIGNHLSDLFVCKNDARTVVDMVKAKLNEWGVREENFVYDLNGVGQTFKGFFPRAIPFNNTEAVQPDFKGIYANLKSQAMYTLADKIIRKEISIEPFLLERRYSGKGFSNQKLEDILMRERKVVRRDENSSDNAWKIIPKRTMKQLIGNSPDFIEGMGMGMIFHIIPQKKKVRMNMPFRVQQKSRFNGGQVRYRF